MLDFDKKSKAHDSDNDGDLSNEDCAGEMTWSKTVFTQDLSKAQLKNKKKRIHSNSFSHSGANGLSVKGVTSDRDSLVHAMQKVRINSASANTRLPFSKNSKKSRNGYKHSPNKRVGKNLPRPIDDMDEIELDEADPDYDSELNDPVFLEEIRPSLPDVEFEDHVNALLKEYFSHSQTADLIASLLELNPSSAQRRKFPYLSINLALQFKLRECEMTSTLLSSMYGKVISAPQMQHGFHLVLTLLPETVIDVPKAPEFVGRFVARAIADEILPPCFVKRQRTALMTDAVLHSQHQFHKHPVTILGGHSASLDDTMQGEMGGGATAVVAPRIALRSNSGGDTCLTSAVPPTRGGRKFTGANGDTATNSSGVSSTMEEDSATINIIKQALDKAENLLVLDHAYTRLNHVWGVKVGLGANKFLMQKMKTLLVELLISDDIEEATRCLQELDAPHFHHELVYQAILLVIEKGSDVALKRINRFLNSLSRTVVLTINQLVTGVKRIYTDMPDIQIDTPKAYSTLDAFMKASLELGYMPKNLVNEMPTKARRRFISEGDALHNRTALLDA